MFSPIFITFAENARSNFCTAPGEHNDNEYVEMVKIGSLFSDFRDSVFGI
jgi:hypothetical protein